MAAKTPAEHARRIPDPFDVLRTTRALAPHDPKLNDTRWLIGEALRRVNARAEIARRQPASESATHALGKIHMAAGLAGPNAWPIVQRVVIEGRRVGECRELVPEVATPWRCDVVALDRLRVALDALGALMGVMTHGRAPTNEGEEPF
jgi:hypothetical protein